MAVDFVQGRVVPRVTCYLRYAAEQALARSAHREAVELLQEALDLLQNLPESAERAQHELAVQATLAPALMVIQGWGSPEAKLEYQRGKELSGQLDDQSRHAGVPVGCIIGGSRRLPAVAGSVGWARSRTAARAHSWSSLMTFWPVRCSIRDPSVNLWNMLKDYRLKPVDSFATESRVAAEAA